MKVRNRNEFIRDFIIGELTKKGMTVGDVAEQINKGPSTVSACIRGITSTPEIRNYIIDLIEVDPWRTYPEQSYVPPTEKCTKGV